MFRAVQQKRKQLPHSVFIFVIAYVTRYSHVCSYLAPLDCWCFGFPIALSSVGLDLPTRQPLGNLLCRSTALPSWIVVVPCLRNAQATTMVVLVIFPRPSAALWLGLGPAPHKSRVAPLLPWWTRRSIELSTRSGCRRWCTTSQRWNLPPTARSVPSLSSSRRTATDTGRSRQHFIWPTPPAPTPLPLPRLRYVVCACCSDFDASRCIPP